MNARTVAIFEALAQFGVKAGLEARPPKLGPLLDALDAALSSRL